LKDGAQIFGHKQLKARWRLAMANFLRVELRTSRIFVTLAMKTVSVDDQARYARIARGAYLSVLHFAPRASLDQMEKTRLTEELDHINSTLACFENSFTFAESTQHELERLTELSEDLPSFRPEIQSLARQAQRFENECERTRDCVQQMLAQNYRLMAQHPERAALP
jgi:septal ring factor EnvC (AmiA/AmiB activator)